MAKWTMSDRQCATIEAAGSDFAMAAMEGGRPLHVVRECLIRGFDEMAAELLEAGDGMG